MRNLLVYAFSDPDLVFVWSSAEAVAQMIVAEIEDRAWEVPDWFPRSYLM